LIGTIRLCVSTMQVELPGRMARLPKLSGPLAPTDAESIATPTSRALGQIDADGAELLIAFKLADRHVERGGAAALLPQAPGVMARRANRAAPSSRWFVVVGSGEHALCWSGGRRRVRVS